VGKALLLEKFIKASEPNDRKIYLTSVGYSLFHLGLMWYASLTHGHAPSDALVSVHIVFVGMLYALPKEIIRWQNGLQPSKNQAGHLLVMVWFASFLIMGVADRIPEGMTAMTCFLVGTLGATIASKATHEIKNRSGLVTESSSIISTADNEKKSG
jgi:hypothetical protein